MIRIIDNVIPKDYQDKLETYFLGTNFPWFFTSDIVGGGEFSGVGFSHSLITLDKKNKSPAYEHVISLVNQISNKIKINISAIHGRSFLQIPSRSSKYNDLFHVDIDEPHLVYLYYVNNSDGNTIISKEKFEKNKCLIKPKDYKPKILQEVCPKKGRVVVFDGSLYHAAGIPKKNPRCILNFSVVANDLT
jgi:hypothetical protein